MHDSFVRSLRSLAIYCYFQFRKLVESDVIKEIKWPACGKSVGYCSVWDKSIKTGVKIGTKLWRDLSSVKTSVHFRELECGLNVNMKHWIAFLGEITIVLI